ncbi:MAG: hypothetical protein ACLP50_34530 [Solirubrobacteraceae bacterium]
MQFTHSTRLARRCGPLLISLIVAGTLIVPSAALAGGFTAHLSVPTHTPKVGKMPLTVIATRGRQKLSGTVSYQFLFDGTVVSHQPGGPFHNGVYHDTMVWPGRAIGHTITLQVVVTTRYGTDYLDWWIKVYPA